MGPVSESAANAAGSEYRLRWLPIVCGGVVIAIADGILFSTWWGLRGTSGLRILQLIAGGLIGREAAFAGGAATMLLGAALHTVFAIAFVAVYAAAARFLPALLTRSFVFAPLYGAATFVVMNHVVVPLSRLGPAKATPLDWYLACIAFHVVVVGSVSAYFARRALRGDRSRTAAAG